jgi:hypothetical protein
MGWGIIRVVIFGTAFLIGLLFGSGVSSSDPQIDARQVGGEINEPRCEKKTFVLVHAQPGRFLAMR